MQRPGKDAPILVVNAGSSSIKFAVFGDGSQAKLTGTADGIGGDAHIRVGDQTRKADLPDHDSALSAVIEALDTHDMPITGFRAAAHRVVHGGTDLTAPAKVTSEVHQQITDCIPLAPLHNPHNLSAIDALARLAPDLPQFASFDTGFHANMPAVETHYAVPSDITGQGIRRYGFHGISYASLVRLLPELSGQALPGRVLAFHLGNGVSACAIHNGQSVATTMGYSPLEGMTMGTRSGDIDANAVLRLAQQSGIEETSKVLNHQSGLHGLSGGLSDMRALLDEQTPDSRFAIAHFCHSAIRHGGALIAAMRGCDAVAFTGGIGENAAPVRAAIMDGLAWLGLEYNRAANDAGQTALHADGSDLTAWIVPAQEERMIAADAQQLLDGADA